MLLKLYPKSSPSLHVVARPRSNSQRIRDVAPEAGTGPIYVREHFCAARRLASPSYEIVVAFYASSRATWTSAISVVLSFAALQPSQGRERI